MQVCIVKLFKAEGKKLISFQIELRCSELLSIVLKLKKFIFSKNFRTIILLINLAMNVVAQFSCVAPLGEPGSQSPPKGIFSKSKTKSQFGKTVSC